MSFISVPEDTHINIVSNKPTVKWLFLYMKDINLIFHESQLSRLLKNKGLVQSLALIFKMVYI